MSYPRYVQGSVYTSSVETRIAFIRKTYTHLTGAILAFTALSAQFYISGVGESILRSMMSGGTISWLLIFGGFVLVGYLAQAFARSRVSIGLQYLGLAMYVVAEALIFSPFLFLAARYYPGVLPSAAVITLAVFIGLSACVMLYNKDFSFLGGFLAVAMFAAIGVIIVAALFGISLGMWFSALMILLASGAILYSTSNVMRYYPATMYVAAALDLFAAVALLFWYVLRILMELQGGGRRV